MDGTQFRRAVLAAALGMGVWAGLARAQQPTAPQAAPAQPSTVVINGVIYTSTGMPATSPVILPASGTTSAAPFAPSCNTCNTCAAAPEPDKGHTSHPVLTFIHDHKPVGCWTHFNNYSCSTWESEYAFIFGSCRNFFGEPCMGKPEPSFPGEQPPRNICPNCARP